MAKNMIDSLGADWFHKRLTGGHFVLDGNVMRVMGVDNKRVVCKNVKTGDHKDMPRDFFTGFKIFAYPALGYRKYSDDLALFLRKKHSWNRGLRRNCLSYQCSPVTTYIITKYGNDMAKLGKNVQPPDDIVSLAMLPEYDPPTKVPDVLAGKRATVVLSSDVIVEPNMNREEAEDYIIYFRERPCGNITAAGEIHWYTDEYKQAASNIVRPRGSW